MEFAVSDSSGTDDDLPPLQQNRFVMQGRTGGNARPAAVSNPQLFQMQNDLETQIHRIEQEAYMSVLRAFKAQSDAITWEKEGLITELRKELRVSDDEHRQLLSKVNADDIIGRIREWRQASGPHPGHDSVHDPTVLASVKKQKTSQSVASLSAGAPSAALDPPFQPSSSALRRGPGPEARGKKPKSISPEGNRRDGSSSGPVQGLKNPTPHGGTTKGTVRGQQKKDLPSLENGIEKKTLRDIEILQTNALIEQADKIFNATHVDPLEVEKARKLLKDHEQALIDAIAMLEGVSDSESDGENQRQNKTRSRLRTL